MPETAMAMQQGEDAPMEVQRSRARARVLGAARRTAREVRLRSEAELVVACRELVEAVDALERVEGEG